MHNLAQTKGSSWDILKGTVAEFMEDSVPRLAAALAYYSMFSLGPLLVIVIGLAAMVFDRGAVSTEVHAQIQSFMGPTAAKTVETMLTTQNHDSSLLATILGVVALLFGATGVFGQLQDALNTIWEVKPKPGQGVWGFVRSRFLSFTMVLGIAFLLLVSMVVTTTLQALSGRINQWIPMPEAVAHILQFSVSFLVISLLFAMIYKVLPDANVQWRDVWVGALGTSLLFTIGKFLLALYLGRESTSSAYGAAGSVVILLLWVYYSSLILFFGAEFTQVYAKATGSRIVPSSHAMAVTEEGRAQEGIPHHDALVEAALSQGAEATTPPAALENRPSDPVDRRNGTTSKNSVSLVASALGAGFVGGWIVHRRLASRASRLKVESGFGICRPFVRR